MFSLFQRGSTSLKTTTFILLWASMVHAELKDVFFHYLVGGITEAEAIQDVQQAKALGVDAFALNLQSASEEWSTGAVDTLFAAAQANDFKLFFSFDMTYFTDPSQFIPYLAAYIGNSAYYHHDGLPFVSTFYGGELTFGQDTPNDGWQTAYVDALASQGISTYFVPSFSDSPDASGLDFYNNFTSVNGALSWTSWPTVGSNASVSTTLDETYMSTRPPIKTYMMALSPLQYKHLSPTQNWYRSGSRNLIYRIPQILSVAPDFLEILTWNDNGESHYFGEIWPESEPASYSQGYDHVGWQALIPTLIAAFKNGTNDTETLVPSNNEIIQGAFWHHTLTRNADCGADELGPPDGVEDVEDVVSIGFYASAAAQIRSFRMRAWSGGALVGEEVVVKGYNSWNVPMRVGRQYVEVVDEELNVLFSGSGPIQTASEGAVCNYNFQVVEIAEGKATASSKREAKRHLHRHLN